MTPTMKRRYAKRIGLAIQRAREACGMSQSDLGQKCSMARSTVAHFERGRTIPSALNLHRLADALDCTVDEFLGRE